MPARKRATFKIIILAAGKGTRMKSNRAKVLHQLMGRPILSYIVDTAKKLSSSGIYVIVGYKAKTVEETFCNQELSFVRQSEPLGTGHAVLCTEGVLSGYEGDVLILCGDVPFLKPNTANRLIEQHVTRKAALSVLTTVVDDPSYYGRVIKDREGNILRIVEDKDATPEEKQVREVNTGIYYAKFPVLIEALKRVGKGNVPGEYYLTDAVYIIQEMGYKVISILTGQPDEVMGINSRADLARAAERMRGDINRKWMLEGVTILDPSNTYIEPSIVIGQDTLLYPYVYLAGNTHIGKDTIIYSSCQIYNAEIGSHSRIGPFAVIRESRIADGEEVGPFEAVVNRG